MQRLFKTEFQLGMSKFARYSGVSQVNLQQKCTGLDAVLCTQHGLKQTVHPIIAPDSWRYSVNARLTQD